MRSFKIAMLLLIAFCSCRGNTNRSSASKYDYIETIEYHNEYENGRIVKTLVMGSGIHVNSNVVEQTDAYEHDYMYEKDSLICKMEYRIDPLSGGRTLLYTTNYSAGREERIGWKGKDTTSYELREYNSDSTQVYFKKRNRLIAPAYDLVIDDNFEEWEVYDKDEHRIESTRRDLATGKANTIKYFHGVKPTIRPNEDVTVVYFEEECVGDTIITKRYENDVLADIYKTYEDGKSKYELTLTPDYDLVLLNETIERGNEKIEITNFPEFKSTDSLFYLNNKKIRWVAVSPDFRTITEYDSYGNIFRETKMFKFN